MAPALMNAMRIGLVYGRDSNPVPALNPTDNKEVASGATEG